MYRMIAIALAFVGLLPGALKAQEFTQRQQEIFQATAAVDGYLTESNHKEFWDIVKASPSYYPGVEQDLLAVLGPLVLDGLAFQKETWASIEQSYAASNVVKTDGFLAARRKLEEQSDPSMRAAVLSGLLKADAIIEAAAERKAYSSGDINLFITPELIEKVKTGLDASFFRVKLLTDPTWSSKPLEWQLKEARMRVISASPFTYQQQDLALGNGVKSTVSAYSLNLDGKNFIGLQSVKVSAGVDDSDATLIRIAGSALSAAGLSQPSVVAMKFRGEASAVATGQASTDQGQIYGSVRAVRPSSREDIVLFVAISASSQIDADTHREQLELSTVVE